MKSLILCEGVDDVYVIGYYLHNLMAAIASEGSLVVEKAKEYIDGLKKDLEKYLKHERLELKAKFSAVISVTNPERSTATFDKLLMSHDWERYPTIRNNFSAFNEFLT